MCSYLLTGSPHLSIMHNVHYLICIDRSISKLKGSRLWPQRRNGRSGNARRAGKRYRWPDRKDHGRRARYFHTAGFYCIWLDGYRQTGSLCRCGARVWPLCGRWAERKKSVLWRWNAVYSVCTGRTGALPSPVFDASKGPGIQCHEFHAAFTGVGSPNACKHLPYHHRGSETLFPRSVVRRA